MNLINLWGFVLIKEQGNDFLLKRNKTCVYFREKKGFEVFKHIDTYYYISSGVEHMDFTTLTNHINKIDGIHI